MLRKIPHDKETHNCLWVPMRTKVPEGQELFLMQEQKENFSHHPQLNKTVNVLFSFAAGNSH